MADESVNIPIEYTAKTSGVEKALSQLSKKTKDAINAGNVNNSSIAKLSTQLAKAQLELDKMVEKTKKIEVDTGAFKYLNSLIDEAKNKIQSLTNAQEALNKSLNNSSSGYTKIKAEIKELTTTLNAQMSKRDEIDSQIINKRAILKDLQITRDAVRASISDIKNQLKSTSDAMQQASLQEALKTQRDHLEQLRHEIASTSGSIGLLQSNLNATDSEIQKINTNLKYNQESLSISERAIEKERQKLQEYDNAIADTVATLNAYETKAEAMRQSGEATLVPENAEAQLKVYAASINELILKIQGLESKIAELNGQKIQPDTSGIDNIKSKLEETQLPVLGAWEAVKGLGNYIKNVWSNLPIKNPFEVLAIGVIKVENKIKTKLQAYKERIIKMAKDTEGAEKTFRKFINTLKDVGKTAVNATGKLLALPLKAAGNAITNLHSKIKNLQKMLGRMIIRKVFNLALQAIIKFAKESVQELAKFSGSFNRSISEMMSSFQYLGRNIVSAIAPILEAITPLITEFVDKMTEAVIKVNSFFSALTGKKQMVVAKKQQYDYAKSLEETAKAAEKAAEQLGYYDKLNVIGQDNQNTDNNIASPFSYQNLDTQSAISDFAKKVKEAWKKADFTEVATILTNKFTSILNKFNSDIVPKMQETATKLGRSLATFLNGVFNNTAMWEELGKSIGNIVNTIIRFFYEFITGTNWGSIGRALALMLSQAIRTINWGQLAQTISNGIKGFLDFAISFLENLDTKALGESIATFLLNIDWWGIIQRVFKLIWVIIKSVVSTAFSTISTLFSESSTGGKVLLGIITAIITAMGVLKVVNFIPTLVQGVIGFASTVAKVLVPALTTIKTLGGALIKGIMIAGKGLLAFLTSPAGIITVVVAAIIGLVILIIKNWDKIKPVLDKAWAKVKEIANKIVEKIKSAKDKVVGFIQTLASKVKSIFNGIKSFIAGIVNWILGGVEKLVNGVIFMINTVISALNSFKISIPDWVPKFGGSQLGFNINKISYVQLPRLAQGAVIPPNKQFLAMLGDQKKGYNIETPLDTMIEAFETALDNRGNSGTSTIILQLDRREVARIVYDSMEKRYKQTGRFLRGVEV